MLHREDCASVDIRFVQPRGATVIPSGAVRDRQVHGMLRLA
jgi:hypothetical protein